MKRWSNGPNREFKFMRLFLVLLSLILSACSHHKFHLLEDKKISDKDYKKIIKAYTQSDRKYEIPDEIYTLKAVFLSSQVKEAKLERKRFYFQWSDEKYRQELKKQTRKLKKSSEFLVTLYTPNRQESNLQNQRSLWNLFLIYKSRRYKLRITSYSKNYNDLKFLYPPVDRWSKKYMVYVDLPTKDLETKGFSLVLSGREGQSVLKFKKSSVKEKIGANR